MGRPAVRRAAVASSAAVTVGAAIASQGLEVASSAAVGVSVPVVDGLLLYGWLALPVVGAVVLWYRAAQPIGRLLVGMGLAGAVQLMSHAWAIWALRSHPGLPGGTVGAAVASWLSVPTLGALAFLPALLPDGRVRGRLRGFAWWAVGALGGLTAAQAVAPEPLDGLPRGMSPIANPLGVQALRPVVDVLTPLCVVVLLAFAATATIDLVRRSRAAQGEARQQLRWLTSACAVLPLSAAATAVLSLLGRPTAAEVVLTAGQVGFLVGLAAAMGVAVLRYRLWDLDLVLRRSYVLAGVGSCLALLYSATVALAGYALAPDGGAPTVLATVAVAVAVQPLRRGVGAWVERLVLRGRREPYAVLTALGERLEVARAPEAALQEVLETVARELQRPAVRLELAGEAPAEAVGGPEERFAVTHRGRQLGELVVGLRRPGERLEPADRQLLTDLARQAAALVDAVRMERELEQSRERLLRERAVERARLRRDLHDGLGPTLASLTLRVEVAADGVQPGSASDAQLQAVRVGLQEAVQSVRRIVDDLRPPELAVHGLVAALQQRFADFPDSGSARAHPVIEVQAETLGPLPTAVELALYRIASEAVTNVLRHAEATRCQVRLTRAAGSVSLDVVDDGVGLAACRPQGVGLRSMHERATALGGSCHVGPSDRAGTRVSVVVPVPR